MSYFPAKDLWNFGLVETSEGGFAPPCGSNNNPAQALLYSSYALSFDPFRVGI